jgi:hypothetical protein
MTPNANNWSQPSQGNEEPEPGDIVIGIDVNCGANVAGMDGRNQPYAIKISYRRDGGPDVPAKPRVPAPPLPTPKSPRKGSPIEFFTPQSGSVVHDGITYIYATIWGNTADSDKGHVAGEGSGDTSADAAGRILEAVENAVAARHIKPGDIIVQHNGKPDANDGGGLGRIILRDPTHYDAGSNDGKIDLFVMDPAICIPEVDPGSQPKKSKKNPAIRIPLPPTSKDWMPARKPITPPPPEGEKGPKPYRSKSTNEQRPGTGDWRRFWDKGNKWARPLPPRPRWTVSGNWQEQTVTASIATPEISIVLFGSDNAMGYQDSIIIRGPASIAPCRWLSAACSWLRNLGLKARVMGGELQLEQVVDARTNIGVIVLHGERGSVLGMHADESLPVGAISSTILQRPSQDWIALHAAKLHTGFTSLQINQIEPNRSDANQGWLDAVDIVGALYRD